MLASGLAAAHSRCLPHTQRLHLGAAPADAIPATRFLDVDFLRDEARRYAERLDSTDTRAAASVWCKHYVSAFVPAVCALMTLEGVGLDARAAACSIERRDGVPFAAHLDAPRILAHEPRAKAPVAGADRASNAEGLRAFVLPVLLDGHLAPLFAALREASGLPPTVAWSNVGNKLAWYYDQFALTAPEAAREDRRLLFEDKSRPFMTR